MVEELHSVILDTKEGCHQERLQRAEVIKKDFAVEIRNYYRKVQKSCCSCWVLLVGQFRGDAMWEKNSYVKMLLFLDWWVLFRSRGCQLTHLLYLPFGSYV
jgi:hypothetical protein